MLYKNKKTLHIYIHIKIRRHFHSTLMQAINFISNIKVATKKVKWIGIFSSNKQFEIYVY